ncbi:hypothetical protein BDW22DRAFT_1425989 [Trametopsis cervina]|nr:hypothetical protein BDW22DRAFT_1425989 [Trametopsis cervina]
MTYRRQALDEPVRLPRASPPGPVAIQSAHQAAAFANLPDVHSEVGGTTSGPGLGVANGLPVPGSAVNQTAGTAQVQHHPNHNPHDPYANYAPYPGVVPYNAPYASSSSTPFYLHPSQAHPSSNDPHQQHGEPSQHPGLADLGDQQQQNHHGSQHTHLPEVSRQEPIHSPEHAQHSQPPYHSPADTSPQDLSPSSPSGTPNTAKRGPPTSAGSLEDQTPAQKKRKQRAEHGDGIREDTDLGPAGGAKHWTDEEKSKLFHWMLTDEDRWEAFGTKMNTIFREGASSLFNSRKTFTALKSCYHRNLDVFKQIYAFEAFLARSPTVTRPESGTPPSPSSTSEVLGQRELQEIADEPVPLVFSTPAHRQGFLERKLDAARSLNVPVGNLTTRVLDHWQEMGWYMLFKKRFREDPTTGLPIPRYLSSRKREVQASPDGRMEEDEEGDNGTTSTQPSLDALTDAQRRHLDSSDCLIPPPFPNQPIMSRGTSAAHRSQRPTPPPSTPSVPSFVSASPHSNVSPQAPPYSYPPPPGSIPFYPPPPAPPGDYHPAQLIQQQLHLQAQTAQALTHLTSMTQTLLSTCTTLTELIRAQTEDNKVQTELMKKREERDEAAALSSTPGNESQRAALATDMLSNPRAPEEIKKLAADYLKRLFQ